MTTNDRLFDEKYEKMIREKCSDTSRWSWPAGVAYILDPHAKQEKEILESIYKNYPQSIHKKQIKNRITSCNDDDFWGAWAELRIYDWLSYKGLKLMPEYILGEGRPDYLVEYPIEKNYRKVIMEVTTVNAENQSSIQEDKRLKQMLAALDEIASSENYIFWIYIPSYRLPFGFQGNYQQLKASFERQLNKAIKNNANEFFCRTNEVNIGIKILGTVNNRKGYIGGYSPGLMKEEEKNFKKRIYDRILEKVGKYASELENIKIPFVITIFIKGSFFLGSFEETISEIINLNNSVQILSSKKLSAILLYETCAFRENDGAITINYVDWLYINPHAQYPVDASFECVLNV